MIVDGEVVPISAARAASAVVIEPAPIVPLRARTPHAKPGLITCADISGPNMVRFKLREGTAAHFDEGTRSIVADTGARLLAATSSDLGTANGLGDYLAPQFSRPVAELRDLKARAQAASGEETADLSLWFELGVGARGVRSVATTDRALCDRVANVVNELNALDSVEIAFVPSRLSAPTLPFLTQASDLTPITPAWEPPHLGPASAGGMNSPDYTGYLPTSWISAYRGSSVGVIDTEWDFTNHEKFNVYRVRDASNGEGVLTGQNVGHANASMGAAFGTARSFGSSSYSRYGTRGFAPEARRGFSGIINESWWGRYEDPAEAVADAGAVADPGDIILIEVSPGCDDGDYICDPIDTETDVADAINAYSTNGRIFVVPMGNGYKNGLGDGTDRGAVRHSLAIYVAATDDNGVTRMTWSNYGSLVDLNGWGHRVWAPYALDGTGGCWLPAPVGSDCGSTPTSSAQAYISDFGGTSGASAVTTGALAQMESLYEGVYGHAMGFTANRNATVLRDTARAGATIVPSVGPNVFGLQSDVYHTAMHVIPATRFGRPYWSATGAGLLAPHVEYLAWAWPASGAETSNALSGSIHSITPNAGLTLMERAAGMTTNGPLDFGAGNDSFSIAFRTYGISAPTSQWQTVVAKENPRNYSVALYPTSFGATAGKVEFSYMPQNTNYFCPVASNTSIANGALHDVVIVFNNRAVYTPVISFYIDGVLDATRYGCAVGGATTNIGADQSMATLAANLEANSYVGDIRLYRRQLFSTEITDYHNGVN